VYLTIEKKIKELFLSGDKSLPKDKVKEANVTLVSIHEAIHKIVAEVV